MTGLSLVLAAIGLIFVIEGLLCLAVPNFLRRTMKAMLELSNSTIQKTGMAAAIFGAVLLWLIA